MSGEPVRTGFFVVVLVGFAEVGCGVDGFAVVFFAEVGWAVVGFAVVGFAVVGFAVVGFAVVGSAVVRCWTEPDVDPPLDLFEVGAPPPDPAEDVALLSLTGAVDVGEVDGTGWLVAGCGVAAGCGVGSGG